LAANGPLIGSKGGGLNLGAAIDGRSIWRRSELHQAACRPKEDDHKAVSGGWVGPALGFGLVGCGRQVLYPFFRIHFFFLFLIYSFEISNLIYNLLCRNLNL
jgi:hypothetical protein